jgi:DNA-3-methyladenine glycosylase
VTTSCTSAIPRGRRPISSIDIDLVNLDPGRQLRREFFARDSKVVARSLLNKVVVAGSVSGRIVEVEAYGGAVDPGSHSYRGPTARNGTMFGPAGRLYVYFTYGMHWCANAVCGQEGNGIAVLLRALAPLGGVDEMASRRPAARKPTDLCSGPAKLCQALGIDGSFDGIDMTTPGAAVMIVDDGIAPPARSGRSTRIGLSDGADLPWRWFVRGDPNLSRREPKSVPS